MAIGAYAAALLTCTPAGPSPSVLAAGMAPGARRRAARPARRCASRGVFLAIATIGFGEVVRLGFVNWDYISGAHGHRRAFRSSPPSGIIYLALALAIYVFWRLRGSKWGFALEAIREDEPAARTMGIATARYKLAMLVLGAALAGLAGGLEAHFTFMVAPNGFAFGRVVDMLVFAVVGGTGDVLGAGGRRDLAHAAARGAPRGRAAGGIEPGPLRLMVNGLVLLAVILFLPNGLVSLPERLRDRRAVRRAA